MTLTFTWLVLLVLHSHGWVNWQTHSSAMHSHIHTCLNHILLEHKQHCVCVQSAERILTHTRGSYNHLLHSFQAVLKNCRSWNILYSEKKNSRERIVVLKVQLAHPGSLQCSISHYLSEHTKLAKVPGQCWALALISAQTEHSHISCLLPLQQLKNGDNRTQHMNCFAPADFKGEKVGKEWAVNC